MNQGERKCGLARLSLEKEMDEGKVVIRKRIPISMEVETWIGMQPALPKQN